jgi:hypothetical protein
MYPLHIILSLYHHQDFHFSSFIIIQKYVIQTSKYHHVICTLLVKFFTIFLLSNASISILFFPKISLTTRRVWHLFLKWKSKSKVRSINFSFCHSIYMNVLLIFLFMFLCRARRILGLCYIIVKVCLNFLFPFVAFYTTKSSPFFVLVLQE